VYAQEAMITSNGDSMFNQQQFTKQFNNVLHSSEMNKSTESKNGGNSLERMHEDWQD